MIGMLDYKEVQKDDLMRIIQSHKTWDYSREQYIRLLNMFIEELNAHTTVVPLKTIVCEDTIYVRGEGRARDNEPKKKNINHKYDIAIEFEKIRHKRKHDNEHLTLDEIITIKNLYEDNYSKSEIAEGLRMSRNTINKYCK